jgi:hypothetical protein
MTALDAFLRAAKERGAQDEFLVSLLKEHGWPASSVYQALGRHYAEVTGTPLPPAHGRLETAREAFFHLLAFATLATWIFATGALWFELINQWFPDPAVSYRYWGLYRISWQMASLIVAFPAFVYATRSILRDMEQNPDKAESGVRRWLTNIALLITALVFIGDLMSFVNSFLQGELTVRFVLQCLTVFVLAGAVFLYYSRGLGKSGIPPRIWHRGFAVAAAAAIVLSLALGFVRTGSPSDTRQRTEDSRRVQDLHRIAQQINDRWMRQPPATRKLPESLEAFGSSTESGLVLSDPFTKEPYIYSPGHDAKYQLCATFARQTDSPPDQARPAWAHGAGPHCFDLDAERFPPYPNAIY